MWFFSKIENEAQHRARFLELNYGPNNPAKVNHPNKGKKASPETRERLRLSHLGKPSYWKGKHRPIETRVKISRKLMGHHYTHVSEAQKLYLSFLKKGKPVANFLNANRLEVGKKISATNEAKRQRGEPLHGKEWLVKIRKHLRTVQFKSKRTSIELLMQESLAKRNLAFIANVGVEGICNVDAKLLDYGVVILCHGCYWHGCTKCFPNLKSIRGLPVEQKHKYDEEVVWKFSKKGIYPIVAWEHEFRQNPDVVGDRIDDVLYLYRQLMETEGGQSLIDSYFEVEY